MANWLLDHLLGMKRGEVAAPIAAAIPGVGQVVDEVNSVVGLVPAKVTTTTITNLDPAVVAQITHVADTTVKWLNVKLVAAGLPLQDVAALDGELAAFIKQETGGVIDETAQFPGG